MTFEYPKKNHGVCSLSDQTPWVASGLAADRSPDPRGPEPGAARGACGLAAGGAQSQELGAECGLCTDDVGDERGSNERRRWERVRVCFVFL